MLCSIWRINYTCKLWWWIILILFPRWKVQDSVRAIMLLRCLINIKVSWKLSYKNIFILIIGKINSTIFTMSQFCVKQLTISKGRCCNKLLQSVTNFKVERHLAAIICSPMSNLKPRTQTHNLANGQTKFNSTL